MGPRRSMSVSGTLLRRRLSVLLPAPLTRFLACEAHIFRLNELIKCHLCSTARPPSRGSLSVNDLSSMSFHQARFAANYEPPRRCKFHSAKGSGRSIRVPIPRLRSRLPGRPFESRRHITAPRGQTPRKHQWLSVMRRSTLTFRSLITRPICFANARFTFPSITSHPPFCETPGPLPCSQASPVRQRASRIRSSTP